MSYEFNGLKRRQQPRKSSDASWGEFAIFQILKKLEELGAWADVRDLCEEQIKITPEWLTPYLCGGTAHANLGEFDAAIQLLEHVEAEARSSPEYSAAARVLKQIRQESATQRRGKASS